VGSCPVRPTRLCRIRAYRVSPRFRGGGRRPAGRSTSRCRSRSTQRSRCVHDHTLPGVCRDMGGLDEFGGASSGAASGDPQSGDAVVHRPCPSTQRRTGSGVVRVCGRYLSGPAPRVAGRSSLVPCLRGRRGDRVHRGLFAGGVPGFGQSPAGCCAASALRGTGSAVPRPGLAPAGRAYRAWNPPAHPHRPDGPPRRCGRTARSVRSAAMGRHRVGWWLSARLMVMAGYFLRGPGHGPVPAP
jgi:hypothetical protein